jgi:hypothetical protein
VRLHHHILHTILLRQDCFDFSCFHTEAAHLHLRIHAPKKLDVAVRHVAGQIAGLVKLSSRRPIVMHLVAIAVARDERIINESLTRQLLALQIPIGQYLAANVQLARHSHRQRREMCIENVIPAGGPPA